MLGNKRLKADIKLLVMEGLTAKGILCRGRWKDYFEKEKNINRIIKQVAIQHVKDNPNKYPNFLVDKANELHVKDD